MGRTEDPNRFSLVNLGGERTRNLKAGAPDRWGRGEWEGSCERAWTGEGPPTQTLHRKESSPRVQPTTNTERQFSESFEREALKEETPWTVKRRGSSSGPLYSLMSRLETTLWAEWRWSCFRTLCPRPPRILGNVQKLIFRSVSHTFAFAGNYVLESTGNYFGWGINSEPNVSVNF